MTPNTCLTAIVAAALATAGCNAVLGFKDPQLAQGSNQQDAAIDAPVMDAMVDTMSTACPASCDPFGCEPATTTCRPAKLWVFLTTNAGGSAVSFPGDGIGGRGGADAKCFTAAAAAFPNRGCVAARTHAIIAIDSADDIQSNVAVHRADDDVMVFASWTDLITTGKAPLSNVANAATDAAGVVWSGFGPANSAKCLSWASKLATEAGTIAETRNPIQPGLWLGRTTDTCNLLHRLLCVCWAGG